MTLIHPNAAGIDIGDTLHSVAVPLGRDTECVRTFGAFTCDLAAIVEWLKKCQIDTVAIESTGVYWKNLYSMLIQNDIASCRFVDQKSNIILMGKPGVGKTHLPMQLAWRPSKKAKKFSLYTLMK